MTGQPLRIGIAGLGGAGSKLLPEFAKLDGIVLAAAADIRSESRAAFEREFDCPAYASVAGLCRSPEIDAIYVATPSNLHCEHTLEATRAGKHVLCEKPLATSLSDCDRMIDAAREAGVLLIQGHCKIFDAPVQAMHRIIARGCLGAVFQFDCWNFNDWMQRPRLAAELDTHRGGGVVFRQAPPLVDMARYLIGSPPQSVRAVTGRHAKCLDTEGNFSALVTFAGGEVAMLSFNGHGYFQADSACNTTTEARQNSPRQGPVDIEEKYRWLAITRQPMPPDPRNASLLARLSGDAGVLALSGSNLSLHTEAGVEPVTLEDTHGRAATLIELRDALLEKRPGFPDGVWAKTTLEVCLAILESSRLGKEICITDHDAAKPA